MEHESLIRLTAAGTVFAVMALWEAVQPRRRLGFRRRSRWTANIALQVINGLLARVLVPITAVETALVAKEHDWGLLYQTAWPSPLEIVLAVLALDFAIYIQHVLFHRLPLLWRLHRMHHADQDFDVSTGGRFHTLEILLSALIKCAAVVVIGASAWAVILFEVILNATSLFNHSNIAMPRGIDRWLRHLVVTPDMHRVHHSVHPYEHNRNFGFSFPWWDRIFGTYRAQPRDGHEGMLVGLNYPRDAGTTQNLTQILWIPFLPLESPDAAARPPAPAERAPGDPAGRGEPLPPSLTANDANRE